MVANMVSNSFGTSDVDVELMVGLREGRIGDGAEEGLEASGDSDLVRDPDKGSRALLRLVRRVMTLTSYSII